MELTVQDSSGLSRSLPADTGRPALAVFFKSSCPTCRLVWPLVERLHRQFGSRSTIIGISQEEPSLALPFHRSLGATFEVLYDLGPDFPASNTVGFDSVPHWILLGENSLPEFSFSGWSRNQFEELARLLSARDGIPVPVLIAPGETLPPFKPG